MAEWSVTHTPTYCLPSIDDKYRSLSGGPLNAFINFSGIEFWILMPSRSWSLLVHDITLKLVLHGMRPSHSPDM